MSKLTKNGKNMILENTIVSYSPKDDTIHITSADPDLCGKPFHISLNQSSQTENALRKLLIEQGVIKEELIGANLPEILTHPKEFNENPEIFDLGVSRHGTASWNPAEDSHLGIYGATGSGKTVVANNIILQALNNQDVWDVYCADPKSIEHSHIKDSLINPDNYVTDSEGLHNILNKLLYTTIEIHKERDKGTTFAEAETKRSILFIDEIAEFLMEHPYSSIESSNKRKSMIETLSKILHFGKFAGIYIVFTSQRPDIIKRVLEDILASTILMGKSPEITSKITLNSNVAVRTPKVSGRGWFKFGNTEPTQFQAYVSKLSDSKNISKNS